MSDKRVKDIMTEEELSEVHRLNKKILRAYSEEGIKCYRDEIDSIIENAKQRFYSQERQDNLKN